jgi:catechol 2,3-dioxygenase-like lactoylglutathione lyase family enzyme
MVGLLGCALCPRLTIKAPGDRADKPRDAASRHPPHAPERADSVIDMSGIARLSLTALDCREPRALAEFYAGITGWELDQDGGSWVQLRSDVGATLAFQLAPDHEPPDWPSAERPQQLHLDFDVDDLDVAEEQVLALGARKHEHQPGGESFRVYLDPAGHPFCLVRRTEPTDGG